MPTQPDPALQWRTRSLERAPKLSDEIWRDWTDVTPGGNTRGLMTSPVRELFQNKPELTKVELTIENESERVAIQYRRKPDGL